MSKLPDTWKEVKLKDIATFSQGLQVGVEEQVSTPIDNYVRFIRIVDYTQKNEDIRFVENKGQRYFASKSDIVMVRYGTPGLVGRGIEGIIANNLFKINLDQKIANNDFFEHLLKSSFVQNKLQSGSASTTMPAINFSTLNTVVIPLPPLEEQKKIADILSTVDKKIAFVEENINATEKLKKGLMQKLLTEGIGHTAFKDSEIGRIPKSWEVKKLDNFCSKITDGSHSSPLPTNDTDFYIATVKDMLSNSFNFDSCTRINQTDFELLKANGCKPEEGDVLFSKDGTIGKTFVFHEIGLSLVLLSSIAIIKPKKNFLNSLFLVHVLKSNIFNKQLKGLSSGSALKRLVLKAIKEIKIPCPTLEEQKEIAEILSTVDQKLENLKEKKQSFKELKKGLMQKLLTGEVRV